jgi:hypothetical protein
MCAGRERRSKMNGIQGSNRLAWKWLSRAIHYLTGDMKELPVRSSGGQVSAPVGGICLVDLAECGRSQQNAIAFDQGKV